MATLKKKRPPGTRKKKKEGEEETGPEPEHRTFFGNKYFGVVHTNLLDIQTLEGAATYTWPEEEIEYTGPFANSSVTGEGQLSWPDGSTYQGSFVLGQREGEGSLKRLDGVTYKGSWKQGQRHGQGRLTYATGINVHYDGQWIEGSKHGFGKQVWPSGNVYEGSWVQGEMAGFGEMQWNHGDTYKGTWKAGVPDGEGEYSWANTGGERNEEQQAVNRYIGQWKEGKRHGEGVFIYADGSRYQGGWLHGKKHGVGKVTYADGNIYTGPFQDDWVEGAVERLSVPIVPKKVLDLGGVDNPIRQMMQINDCDEIEIPTLAVADFEQRETHNCLLRNLGEVKQVYHRYRRLLKRAEEDPYCMSTLQLWLFCRDHGLVTHRCGYATINRAVAFGTRYTQEHCATLIQDLRTLAGRRVPKEHVPRKKKTSKQGTRGSRDEDKGEPQRKLSGDAAKGATAKGAAVVAASGSNEPPVELPAATIQAGHNAYWLTESEKPPVWAEASEVDDIHSDGHQILLRHFFEILVRIAVVRFPDLPTIQEKVEELLVNRVVPRLQQDQASNLSESEWIFEHAEEASKSWSFTKIEKLFHRIGRTRGAFGPVEGAEDDLLATLELTPDGGAEVELSKRQSNVMGRRDATLRVKNLFRMMQKIGFLHRKIPADHLNGTQVFPRDEKELEAFQDIGMTKETMLEVQRMTLMPEFGSNMEGLLGGFRTGGGAEFEAGGESALGMLSQDRLLAGMFDEKADEPPPMPPEEAVHLLDFTLSVQEAVSIVTDSFSVDCIEELTCGPNEGNSVVELMEYELTPSEFVRFLYVIAQRRIKGGAGSGGGSAFQEMQRPGELNAATIAGLERLEPNEAFDLYLDLIFFPAFTNVYSFGEEEAEEVEEPVEEEEAAPAEGEEEAAAEGEEAPAEEAPAEEEEEDDGFSAFSASRKDSKQTTELDVPQDRNYVRDLWGGFGAPQTGGPRGVRKMPGHLVAGLKAPQHAPHHAHHKAHTPKAAAGSAAAAVESA